MATDAQRGEVLALSHTARGWQLGSELGLLDSEVLSWGCGRVPRGYRGAVTPVAQGWIPDSTLEGKKNRRGWGW